MRAVLLGREGSGRPDNDPAETRYGCFLPDLTGLASKPSTAGLPVKLYQVAGVDLQAIKAGSRADSGTPYCSTTNEPIMPSRAPLLNGDR